VFELSGNGLKRTIVTRTIAEGTAASLDLEAEPFAPPRATRRADGRDTTRSVAESGSSRDTIMFAAFAAGALGIAVGSVAGLMAFSKSSDLGARCPGGNCPPDLRPEYDEAGRLATIADVSFGIGLAGVAVGSLLLLWPRDSQTRRHTEVSRGVVSVALLPGPAAGFSGAF
jgi:hypothetical protein